MAEITKWACGRLYSPSLRAGSLFGINLCGRGTAGIGRSAGKGPDERIRFGVVGPVEGALGFAVRAVFLESGGDFVAGHRTVEFDVGVSGRRDGLAVLSPFLAGSDQCSALL